MSELRLKNQRERNIACSDAATEKGHRCCASILLVDRSLTLRYPPAQLFAKKLATGNFLNAQSPLRVRAPFIDSHWSIIRTRLKVSIFGAFWIVVLERHEHSFVLRAKTPSKCKPFRSKNLNIIKIFINKAKAQRILDVFASILTQFTGIFIYLNRSSDNTPMAIRFRCKPIFKELFMLRLRTKIHSLS